MTKTTRPVCLASGKPMASCPCADCATPTTALCSCKAPGCLLCLVESLKGPAPKTAA